MPLLWPLALYGAVVLGLVALILALSSVLGQRHRQRTTATPFESGAAATGGVHLRLSVGFYVVAVAFLVFDLEAAFLFGWAVAAPALGFGGFAEALVFIGVLVSGLLYLWQRRILDWGLRVQPGEA